MESNAAANSPRAGRRRASGKEHVSEFGPDAEIAQKPIVETDAAGVGGSIGGRAPAEHDQGVEG